MATARTSWSSKVRPAITRCTLEGPLLEKPNCHAECGIFGNANPSAGHKNAIVELHWTSDGERIITASPDKSVRAWDVASGQQVKKMAEHDSFVNSCCPLRRGPPLLVSGSDDGTAKVSRPLNGPPSGPEQLVM